MDLDAWPYPKQAAGAGRRVGARAVQRRDLPRLHPGLPVLPGRHDHPAGPRAVDHQRSARWSRRGLAASGFERGRPALAVQRGPQRDQRDRRRISPTATRAPTPGCRCRRPGSTRSTSTLANELSRNGRRSGLTFAPEGGTDRIRKVINKMVTEDDLIRTVTTAYANGWRQVKLYFMCGLPTETDEDVLAIAGVAQRVIEAGREATGRRDIRCTVSIGGFVPKPHTPFQWAAQCDHETVDARLQALRRGDAGRPRLRQVDRVPLPRRQAVDRGGTALARRPPGGQGDPRGLGGRRPVRRLERALLLRPLGALRGRGARRPTRRPGLVHDAGARATTRCCRGTTWTPASTGTGCGRTGWPRSIPRRAEVEDCRWTPCFDCGVCPAMDTEIEIGPTGASAAAADRGAARTAPRVRCRAGSEGPAARGRASARTGTGSGYRDATAQCRRAAAACAGGPAPGDQVR